MSIGRNDLCPCKSGKKYKQCCMQTGQTHVASPPSVKVLAAKLLTHAESHCQAGRLLQAEALCQQILKVMPNHAEALHLLGLIAYQEGKRGRAAGFIGRAISLAPTSTMACNLGSVFLAQGKVNEAIASYRQALVLKPDHIEAMTNLGKVFIAQGKLDEASEIY